MPVSQSNGMFSKVNCMLLLLLQFFCLLVYFVHLSFSWEVLPQYSLFFLYIALSSRWLPLISFSFLLLSKIVCFLFLWCTFTWKKRKKECYNARILIKQTVSFSPPQCCLVINCLAGGISIRMIPVSPHGEFAPIIKFIFRVHPNFSKFPRHL